jgi:hypothetical protein
MSILEDFASGFLQTYKADMDKKAANEDDRVRRKQEFADRVRLANEQAKIERRERAVLRDEERANAQEGKGYNPATGMIEWVDANGNPSSRKATQAEVSQYESGKAAAEQQGVLDALTAEEKRANIAQRNARADLSRRTDPNRGREQSFRMSEEDAALVLGVVPSMDERGRKIYTPEQLAKIRELQGQQVDPATYEEMRRLAQQKRNAMQGAANSALSSNLIR